MTIETMLNGVTVLVVEDDFHLATCTSDALRKAGAEVLGPVAREDQALSLIAGQVPSCAIVDINLGEGARFKIADALKARGVPFMFMTGYDDVMIPDRFNDVGRMRKPSGFRLAVQAAAQMCSGQPGHPCLQAGALEYIALSPTRKRTPIEGAVPVAANAGHIPADELGRGGPQHARA
ncbi:hypothetical protein [Paracoccus benzoatiresistens]|uniref:Response regulatory domain-containing protein n=1 Tax=Paracoccus benzoatiresistens TaxID=2997341 RepID=A0ABT4J1T5_9RHOB|nr:hypothetical protein [Paracoccus sp. EF6]MCZ0961048.1 hypothetical protein [Paracoccus sp. EF6]